MDTISVIIPVYKVEAYLRQCLDSVVNQTYKNLEIIIIDDGSPDGCGAICDEYAVRDSRIKLVHQENKGLSAARNVGLDLATGKWISFVDSDDWCELDMYEKALDAAKKSDADITMFPVYRNSGDRQYSFQKYPQSFTSVDKELIYKLQLSCLSGKCAPFSSNCTQGLPWDKLFKASLIQENHLRFMEELYAEEDRVFTLHAFQYAKRVSYLDIKLYHFRYNPYGIGTKYTPNRPQIDENVYHELLRIGQLYSLDQEYFGVCNAFYVNNIFLLGRRCLFTQNTPGGIVNKLQSAHKLLRTEPIRSTLKNANKKYLGIVNRVFVMSQWCPATALFVLTKVKPLVMKFQEYGKTD